MARLLTVTIMFLLLSPVIAQDGYPLPDNLTPITVDNAAQLEELSRIGGALPGSLAWSPDGRWLAAGTTEGVKLYNVDNLSEPPRIIDGGADVAFNVAGDVMVSGGRLWDVETGIVIASLEGYSPRGFSESGNTLVTSGLEDEKLTLRLWDVTNTESVAELATLHTNTDWRFTQAVFSSDDRYVAIVLYTPDPQFDWAAVPLVQLWDGYRGRLVAALEQAYESLRTVVFNHDGSLLVTASGSDAPYGGPLEEVKLWDGHTGELVRGWDYGDSYVFAPLDFNPGSSLMAMSGRDGVQLWDGEDLGALTYEGSWVHDPAFSFDGRTLAAIGNYPHVVLLYDTDAARSLAEPHTVIEVEKEVQELVLSLDGSRLVGNPYGGTLYLWNAQTGDEIAVLEAESSPWEMNFSPDSSLLLTRHFDDTAHLWNASTGERLLTLPETARPNPDWTYAAYWNGGTIDVIDLSNGTPTELVVVEDYLGQTSALNAASRQAVFVQDAPPGLPTSVVGYDLQTGDQSFTLSLVGASWEIAFSQDGRRMATSMYDSSADQPTINLWDTAAPDSPLATLDNGSRLGDLHFDPDGRVLALRSFSGPFAGEVYFGTEQLFDLETQTLASWSIENYGVSSHAFSPNGLFLATGGYDSSVALWDVEATLARAADTDTEEFYGVGLVVVSLDSHSEVPQTAFSPDGEQLAVVVLTGIYPEGDGTRHYQIYLWDVEDLLAVSTAGGWVSTRDEDFVQIVLPDALSPLYSPDGSLLLTGEWESDTLHLWDTRTGEQFSLLTGSTLAAFSPNGALLATHNTDGISLWGVDVLIDGNAPLTVLPADNSNIQEIAFNPDGTLLFVRDTRGVSVWGIP